MLDEHAIGNFEEVLDENQINSLNAHIEESDSLINEMDVIKPIAFSRSETIDGIEFEIISTGISGVDKSDDIKFTQSAINKIIDSKDSANLDQDYFLRIYCVSSLKNGLKYELKFTTIYDEKDLFFKLKDIDLAIDRKSIFFVLGHEIDYIDNDNGSGFTFKNIVKKITRTFYTPELS